MRSQDGFDLALSLDPEPAPLPEWFHWGFKTQDRAQVRQMYHRMVEQGVVITRELLEDDEIVSYRCADPDGHSIEIYSIDA
jgi:catechol 2,3-dioxygenase-like lactoylglutathione lyase family enzyme